MASMFGALPEINAATVHERGIARLARLARHERTQTSAATHELLQRTVQAYRILFTRPLKGLYVWIPDEESRRYVKDSLLTF